MGLNDIQTGNFHVLVLTYTHPSYVSHVNTNTPQTHSRTTLRPLLHCSTYQCIILTYASPVSSAPNRMWCMSLYKGTLSHENFARERRGILQLLRPDHVHCSNIGNSAIGSEAVGDLIRVLGGASGRDVDKRESCAKLGFVWDKLSQIGEVNEEEDDSWPLVLPSCLYYLKLELVGDLIDCGSHEAALCRVVAMLSGDDANDLELDLLSTRQLRRESIISELGRVI